MWSTSSLPLLPGPLGVVIHDTVLSMDQIELFDNLTLCKQMTNVKLNCYCYIAILGNIWGCPSGVMVKATDSGIVVSEFVLHSRYYVHFRANTLGKGMNPLILPAMG